MSQFIQGYDASNKRVKAISVDTSGHLQVDVVSMTGGGDATAANQTSGNASLTTIAGAVNSSKMDVNLTTDSVGLATASKQTTGNTSLATLAGTVNSSQIDVNLKTDTVGLATSTKQTAANSSLATIETNTTASKPDMDQTSLASSSTIASGSNTSEIDMDGYNHLTIYGSSTVNFGSFCLVRRSASSGTDFLDSNQIFSASDPTGGSDYHLAAKFENVGSRYISFRNLDASSQTVTLFAVKSR